MSDSRNMSFVSYGAFWGIIIILIGVSILLKEVFHIHFPFLKVLFGILLIYWGIKVITGSTFRSRDEHTSVFSSGNMQYTDSENEYNIVFGKGKIDLFKMEAPTENKKIEINVVFGNGNVILNDNIPAKVKMTSVFGQVRTSTRQSGGFGTSVFTSTAYKENEPHFMIEANAVFGNIHIDNRKW